MRSLEDVVWGKYVGTLHSRQIRYYITMRLLGQTTANQAELCRL